MKGFCTLLGLGTLVLHAGIADPFAVNNGAIPPKSDYNGSLFAFHYDYPTSHIPIQKMPWHKVLNGKPLTKANAHAYVLALKQYVKPALYNFLADPQAWNESNQTGWYSMLWAGDSVDKTGWEGRDAIYGTYTGQIMAKEVYAASGLTVDIRNHAAIYYNDTAAYTLGKVFSECNQTTNSCIPHVENGESQFEQGAIIIKSAGVTATPQEWPVLEGAATWQVYRKPFDLNGTIVDADPVVTDLRVGIFDIIVKDSVAAPETGWVFSTLVYDRNASGDVWDKMIPLGAMWGNDPDVNSAKNPEQPLQQTYINPQAPAWTKVTLGYGMRLSGPFDIAVKYNVDVNGTIVPALRSSSCMSCHGTSAFIPNDYRMNTFLYPAKEYITTPWKMYTPGSVQWNAWFQNRPGDVPQRQGAIALDYSTFLDAVLMNYVATTSTSKTLTKESFFKWNVYRSISTH